MLAAAAAGYRAIAPDCRGYGLSAQPPEHEEASWEDLVADVLAVLDALSVPTAFVVAKDFGVIPAYHFALRHPERTRGVVCVGISFSPGPWSRSKEGQEIMDLVTDESTPLPEWFTEEDLDVYFSLYEKSGLRYPLKMYRCCSTVLHTYIYK
nr:unnamed protein product [Digitaria exilis]